jgi:WD40 repeat protein
MIRYINFLCLFPVLIYGSRELPKNNTAVQPAAQTAVQNIAINDESYRYPLFNIISSVVPIKQLVLQYVGGDIKYETNFSYKELFKDREVSEIRHAYSSDGKYIAIASKNAKQANKFNDDYSDKVILWDRKNQKVVHEYDNISSPDYILYSPNGAYLLIKESGCKRDGFIILSASTFTNGKRYPSEFASTFDPRIYCSSIDKIVMDDLYSDTILLNVKWATTAYGSALFVYNHIKNQVKKLSAPQCITFRFSGKIGHIAGWSDKELWIWDVDEDKKITNIKLQGYHNIEMAYSTNGLYFAVYTTPGLDGKNGQVQIYDIKQNYKHINTVPIKLDYGVGKLAFSPDSTELFISSDYVYAGIKHSFNLYNISESKIIYTGNFDKSITDVAYSPDGSELSLRLSTRSINAKDDLILINRTAFQEIKKN